MASPGGAFVPAPMMAPVVERRSQAELLARAEKGDLDAITELQDRLQQGWANVPSVDPDIPATIPGDYPVQAGGRALPEPTAAPKIRPYRKVKARELKERADGGDAEARREILTRLGDLRLRAEGTNRQTGEPTVAPNLKDKAEEGLGKLADNLRAFANSATAGEVAPGDALKPDIQGGVERLRSGFMEALDRGMGRVGPGTMPAQLPANMMPEPAPTYPQNEGAPYTGGLPPELTGGAAPGPGAQAAPQAAPQMPTQLPTPDKPYVPPAAQGFDVFAQAVMRDINSDGEGDASAPPISVDPTLGASLVGMQGTGGPKPLLSKTQSANLMRMGAALMAASQPKPGALRGPTAAGAMGEAALNTIDYSDRAEDRRFAKDARAEDVAFRKEKFGYEKSAGATEAAFKREKLKTEVELKTKDQYIELAKVQGDQALKRQIQEYTHQNNQLQAQLKQQEVDVRVQTALNKIDEEARLAGKAVAEDMVTYGTPAARAAALADIKERHDAQARTLLKTNGSWVEGLTHESVKVKEGGAVVPGAGKVPAGTILWRDLSTNQLMMPQKSGR